MIQPAPSLLMNPSRQRLHLRVQGMVQGVGFRPFVYTLATELGLDGWVRNTDSGVDIEIEGSPSQLTTFLERMECDRPPHALFADLETDWLAPWGDSGFEIQPSALDSPTKSAWILPDLATCPACLREIFDQHNRRYQYPFTNCTHCGPRYSILTAIPYDRPHTTMQGFRLCADCQQEYDNPQDRRFHAQPNACSRCGPHLELWDNRGKALLRNATAPELITLAAHSIRKGRILALKGLGGFHLIVDARNEGAVQVLRERKHRPTKPLAVMYPSLDAIREDCIVSAVEAELLCSPTAPIVLLHRRGDRLAVSLAPHQCTLGAMLPYTPLHHLLLAELRFPVVATSGNRSLEPICIDDQDALSALADIVDVFLVHDRPIARPVDDSVVRIVAERPIVLRRARGYAPHLRSPSKNLPCILAVGSHLKNTVALSVQGHILVSQHLGDLDQAQTVERFQDTIHQFLTLYAAEPVAIACDTHPDYASTRFAHALGQQRGIPVIQVQHHYAHVLSGLVDHTLDPPVLGIVWDGMGYGLDRSLWGGEFLTILDRTGFQRRAHLRSFPLPGGDRAAREPRRAALGLLYAAFGEAAFKLDCPTLQAFPPQELKLLQIMLRNHVNTPRTSSVGRLFDAIASLIGLCHQQTFAGEAAMWLESTLEGIPTDEAYPYQYQQDTAGTLVLDWQPMLTAILKDQEPIGVISAKFHNTLVAMIGAIADHMGIEQVLLTGGCFQNRYLLEAAMQQLQGQGFIPHQHQQIPPNDGGIAVGQLLGASWTLQQSKGEEGQCV